VHVEGEHDVETRQLLVEALDPLVGHVIVDLGACTFLDTSVIGAILTKAIALDRDGYRLEVVVPPTSDFLTRTIARLGLRELVAIVDDPPRLRADRG
jgi:anti-anti-sigma regulatory factor